MNAKNQRFLFPLALILLFCAASLAAEPLHSPTWGFSIDLPPDYQYSGGDGKNSFSFTGGNGAALDLVAYPGGSHNSAEELARTIRTRLGSRGEISAFRYGDKEAALMDLSFSRSGGNIGPLEGWALCVELEKDAAGKRPFFLAMAYGPAYDPDYGPQDKEDLQSLYLSILDSVIPSEMERRLPGAVTEFAYPRREQITLPLSGLDAQALFYREDGEAAQALVDREFAVFRRYAVTPHWQEAWQRFYRAVYRDSFSRLADAAFTLERLWNQSASASEGRALAGKVLAWIQSFSYERDLMGSDFVNLVSAATEGRGDCDSRALLWAVVLEHACIPAGIMLSQEYNHAMGLADIAGAGARFEAAGKKWLVAETTSTVSLGLINASSADPAKWLAVIPE